MPRNRRNPDREAAWWMLAVYVAAALLLLLKGAEAQGQEPQQLQDPHGLEASALPRPLDPQTTFMALTMWAEARGEGRRGMRAVGHVIRNRTVSPQFPDDVTGVVLQHRQFSVWLAPIPDPRRTVGADLRAWETALELAEKILSGRDQDPTHGSLFFHEQSISPRWAANARPQTIVGAHVFYASLEQNNDHTP